MKHSLTVVCLLASAIGASSIALASAAAAQRSSAEPPSAPTPAGAAATPRYSSGPAKIAVIVFQQAVAETNEGQRNIAQIQNKFAPKQAELKTESDEIDSLKKQLQGAGANLSEADRDTRLKTIDDKTKTLQRDAQDDQSDFNTAMGDMYQALAQKVYATVDKYAKENGFTVVLDASNQQSSPVLWVNPGVDITKAIVDAYNATSGVPPPAASAAPRPATARPATPRSTTTRPGASHTTP